MMTPDRDSPCYGAISVAGNPKDNLRPEFMMPMASVCSCFGFAPGADTFARSHPFAQAQAHSLVLFDNDRTVEKA